MDRPAVIAILLLGSATIFGACADPTAPAPPIGLGAAAVSSGEDGAKTLKERLSDKASDEQRIDNCGVPLDRRGPLPRPDCAGDAVSPAGKGW